MRLASHWPSPKIIAPVTAALAAFAQAKIHDQAVAALVIALIGAIGLYLAPPGDDVEPGSIELLGAADEDLLDEEEFAGPPDQGARLTPDEAPA